MTLIAQVAAGGLISLLVWLLIFAIVIYVVYLILGMFTLPPKVREIACLIIGVIFLLVLLQRLGFINF
jgi:hypothetical protein